MPFYFLSDARIAGVCPCAWFYLLFAFLFFLKVILLFLLLFLFGVLPAHMDVTHMHTAPSSRGHTGDRVTFFYPFLAHFTSCTISDSLEILLEDLFMLMSVLPAFMCVRHACTSCLWRSEESFETPRNGVMDGCELLCGFWELSTGSLQA